MSKVTTRAAGRCGGGAIRVNTVDCRSSIAAPTPPNALGYTTHAKPTKKKSEKIAW